MSLNYKNNDEILKDYKPKSGLRFNSEHQKLLKGEMIESTFGSLNLDPSGFQSTKRNIDQVELHIYTEFGDYIKSNHSIDNWSVKTSEDGIKRVKLDVHNDIRELDFRQGNFRFIYNFFRNFIGSNDTEDKLFIYEISSSRREIKVKLTNPKSQYLMNQSLYFINNILNSIDSDGLNRKHEFVMNFGFNDIIKIINIRVVSNNEFVFRLYEPLPNKFDVNIQFWLCKELIRPYIDSIHLIPNEEEEKGRILKRANFNLEFEKWSSNETGLKSWNDLLGSNVNTSQKLIDRYFSGSLSGININVDYSRFENFINFSSAEERIKNFVYKISLIEHYDSQLKSFESYTGSLGTNQINVNNYKNNLIGGFDNFEKWLYYDYSSSLFSHASSSIPQYQPYPKQNDDYPYIPYSVSSSEAIDWYNGILTQAVDYDLENDNSLIHSIPEFLLEDEENDGYQLFINMVGHHFDLIWLYVKNMTTMFDRDEHPKVGLSNELLHLVAKSYGWNLTNGSNSDELWKYTFGLDENDTMIVSGSGQNQTKPGRDRTKEVWKRIVNNLPYILKTKGTSRSIKSLISCYGIPNSIITIREFGGPQVDTLVPKYEYTKYENLIRTDEDSYITIPWGELYNNNTYPSTLEVLFRTNPSDVYQYNTQTIFQLGSGSDSKFYVNIEPTSSESEKGNVIFYLSGSNGFISESINDVYLFNGNLHNFYITRNIHTSSNNVNQEYRFGIKSNRYGELFLNETGSIVISGSLGSISQSYNSSWNSDETLYLGKGFNDESNGYFSGSIFSIRYWSNELNESTLNNHTLALRTYNSNTPTSSFYDLGFRLDFNNGNINYGSTSSLISDHPNKNYINFVDGRPLSASLFNMTSASHYPLNIDYKADSLSIGTNSYYSNKIRIEDSVLEGTLSVDKRSELGAYDNNPIDSNKLIVAFSPQHIINEDILESLGHYRLDDYIGDPRDRQKESYENLRIFSEDYWKKYIRPNDFVEYIRVFQEYDFSIFDQIKQTLLSRTNKILGLLIEPNILERNKVNAFDEPTAYDIGKDISINRSSSSIDLDKRNNNNVTIESLEASPEYFLNKRDKIKGEFNKLAQEEIFGLNITDYFANIIQDSFLNVYSDYNHYSVNLYDMITTQSYDKINYAYYSGSWVTQSNHKSFNQITASFYNNYEINSINLVAEKYYSSSVSQSLDLPYSSSLKGSSHYGFLDTSKGLYRSKYSGCVLQASGFNVESKDTPDGKPIVEIIPVVGNQLFTKDLDDSGGLEVI